MAVRFTICTIHPPDTITDLEIGVTAATGNARARLTDLAQAELHSAARSKAYRSEIQAKIARHLLVKARRTSSRQSTRPVGSKLRPKPCGVIETASPRTKV